jgi:hypothetical protein
MDPLTLIMIATGLVLGGAGFLIFLKFGNPTVSGPNTERSVAERHRKASGQIKRTNPPGVQ